MKKIAKLDDSMLSTVAGGHRRHLLPFGFMKKVDVSQSNTALVFAPGAKGDITVNQSNTAVVL